ncbi:MAG: DNA (cytosine-5-)-methyltransferase, partial [Gammaproteobacteria bacterium]|nr:DNA (cytosine-5-)-methyltransferase [Gammaproteobacteria bacterium]
MIKIASLFSEIGGFENGIQQAADKLNIDIEYVLASEKDKYARQIYRKNFGVEPHGDITKIKSTDVPDHDILCGGFPCQDVSIAGKREGLCGARTGLFYDLIKILQKKQPRLVFLENVEGLLSS